MVRFRVSNEGRWVQQGGLKAAGWMLAGDVLVLFPFLVKYT